MMLIVGSYADPGDPGIYIYSFGNAGHDFKLVAQVDGIENPSYLTVAGNRYLYAVSENKTGPCGEIQVYKLTDDRSKVLHLGRLSYQGAGSCFVSVDNDRSHAFIANYDDGSLVVVSLLSDSKLAVDQVLPFSGSGPNFERQEQSHIHCAVLSADQRFLYCTDLGADRLYRFQFNRRGTPLRESEPPYCQLPAGSGPRHMTFSTDGSWLYLICELSGEIFCFSSRNFPIWSVRYSVVAKGFRGKTEAADIQIHPSGRYLYASNRGDANEIVAFEIHPKTGDLSLFQRLPSEGLSPRSILIYEPEALLLVANEQSNDVSLFNIDPDGRLTYSGTQLHISKPACLKRLPDR